MASTDSNSFRSGLRKEPKSSLREQKAWNVTAISLFEIMQTFIFGAFFIRFFFLLFFPFYRVAVAHLHRLMANICSMATTSQVLFAHCLQDLKTDPTWAAKSGKATTGLCISDLQRIGFQRFQITWDKAFVSSKNSTTHSLGSSLTSGSVNADNLIKISIRQANTKQLITRKDMQHAAMPWKEVTPGTRIKSQQDPFHKVMYLLAHFAPDQSSQSARLSTLVTHHTVTHTHTQISIMETARNNFQLVDSKNDTRPWWWIFSPCPPAWPPKLHRANECLAEESGNPSLNFSSDFLSRKHPSRLSIKNIKDIETLQMMLSSIVVLSFCRFDEAHTWRLKPIARLKRLKRLKRTHAIGPIGFLTLPIRKCFWNRARLHQR